jgi:hypothetical protein
MIVVRAAHFRLFYLLLLGGCGRANTHDMTNCIAKISLVHRIEMKGVNSIRMENTALFGGNTGGDKLSGFRIFIKSFKQSMHPVRYIRSTHFCELSCLCKIGNGQNTRNDRNCDPSSACAIEEPEKYLWIKKELSDGAVGARIDFFLQVV